MRTKPLPNRPRNLALIAVSIFAMAISAFAPSAALAQVAPPVDRTARFSVLGHSGVTGSTGLGTTVNGDVGSSPNPAVTNFPPSRVLPPFALHLTNDVVVQGADTDTTTQYNFLAAQGPGTVLAAQLDTAVLTSGIYSFAGGAALLADGGTLTLNGPGIFIFQVDSTLTMNVNSNVIGTADPCNVYWRVGTSATLNGVTFRGRVIASASITVGAGSNVTGQLLAGAGATGAVTMAGGGGNTIGGCAVAPGVVCPAITLSPLLLQDGTVGIAYNATITATGGTGPYTFLVTSGALPAGLMLDGATGGISGIPTTSGPSNFTITATDTFTGCTGFRPYSILVGAPAPVIPTNVPALDFVGLMVLFVLLAGAGLFVMSRF